MANENENKATGLDEISDKKAVKVTTEQLLTGDGDTKNLIIRHDKALVIYERKKWALVGILSTPFLFLSKRVALHNQFAAHLVVNRESLTLALVVDEEDHFNVPVTGKLSEHPDFIKWGLNSGKDHPPHILGDFIKMNRADFESPTVANKLVTDLKGFQAKVNKEIERVENNRGDRKIVQQQTVESNIPDIFTIIVPMFKGYPKQKIEVEIYINPDNLLCSLISPHANELLASVRDEAIDEQIKQIIEIAPNLLITEE